MNKYHYCFDEWVKVENNQESSESIGPNFPKEYQAVAAVEANNIEEVFEKTNHIDKNWAENKGVIPIVCQARSTSVGDIVVDDSGNRKICAGQGWKEI